MPFSMGNSWNKDWIHVSCGSGTAHKFFTAELPWKLKNVQTTMQVCSFHMLAKWCSKSFMLGFSTTWLRNSRCTSWVSKGQKNQRSNCQYSLYHEKPKEFRKIIYFCLIDYTKAFDCVNQNKLWKILKEMRLPDYLTCLLKNLHACQEATLWTRHETTDWFKIGKGVKQGCIFPSCLFNFYMQGTSCVMLGQMNHKLNQDCQKKY